MPSIIGEYAKKHLPRSTTWCYVQPAVRESMRPKINYKRPDLPFAADTVHKNSYLPFDSAAVKGRALPIRPIVNFNANPHIKMDTESVTVLSFPLISGHDRIGPVKHLGCIERSSEPLETQTTHKHDFVSKAVIQPKPFVPFDNLRATESPLSQETVMKTSYSYPHGFVPSENCKRQSKYERPEVHMNTDTCHKLSYLPVGIKRREVPPWAIKPMFVKPIIPIDDSTIQKSSYQPPGQFVEARKCLSSCSNHVDNYYYPRASL